MPSSWPGADEAYPGIVQDFRRTFAILKQLPCDVFLGSHGSFFHLQEKAARLRAGDRLAFVDPAGYREFISRTEKQFADQLRRELMTQ